MTRGRARRPAAAVLALVLALSTAAAAAPGSLDPARIAAIDKAAASFLALAKNGSAKAGPPRQSDPHAAKLLATVFDTAGLNQGAPPPFAQIDALNDWLQRLTEIGMVYLLAGTATADPAGGGDLDDQTKAKIAANAVAFAPEIGHYVDAELAVTQAEIAAILQHMTEDPAVFATEKAQLGLNRMRAQLARTLAGVVTTMPTPGLDPAWPAARLPALAKIAPLAAAFLGADDRRQLHDLALAAADKVKDTAKAGLIAFGQAIAP